MPTVIPEAEALNGKNERAFFGLFRFLIHILNIFLIYNDKIKNNQKF